MMQGVIENTSIFGPGSVNEIDGSRLELGDSWVLVRPSGTEPVIWIIAESQSEADTSRLLDKASSVVESLMRG
jgi:phosphomannomutase/phosphoglucomutase